MTVGQLGYGRNVANNSDPFDLPRTNIITWNIPVGKNCTFDLFIEYASAEDRPGILKINGTKLKVKVPFPSTGGWCPSEQRWTRVEKLTTTAQELIIEIQRIDNPLPNIRAIKLD